MHTYKQPALQISLTPPKNNPSRDEIVRVCICVWYLINKNSRKVHPMKRYETSCSRTKRYICASNLCIPFSIDTDVNEQEVSFLRQSQPARPGTAKQLIMLSEDV